MEEFLNTTEVQFAAFAETHVAEDRKPPRIAGWDVQYTNHTSNASGVAVYAAEGALAVKLEQLCIKKAFKGGSTAALVLTCHVFAQGVTLERSAILSVVYLPPGAPKEVVVSICATLESAAKYAKDVGVELVTVGDLNSECQTLGGMKRRGSKAMVVCCRKFVSANAMFADRCPTHVSGASASVIDHVLSTGQGTVTDLEVVVSDDPVRGPNTPLTPHRLLFAAVPVLSKSVNHKAPPAKPPILPRRIGRAEVEDFQKRVEAKMDTAGLTGHGERCVTPEVIDVYAIRITEAIRAALYTRSAPVKLRGGAKLVVTEDLKRALRRRRRITAAVRKWRLSRNRDAALPAQLKRKKAIADHERNVALRLARAQHWERRCDSVAGELRGGLPDWQRFDQLTTDRRRSAPTVLRVQDAGGNTTTLPPAKSIQYMAEQYGAVFGHHPEWKHSPHRAEAERATSVTEETLRGLPRIGPSVTEEEVRGALRAVPPNKAPGRDGITNSVLKALPAKMIREIAALFDASLGAGHVPTPWKLTKCVALFKKGDALNWKNYRLIALSCTLLKLMEAVVLRRMQAHTKAAQLHCRQFGFRRGHSTADAVYLFHAYVSAAVARSGEVYAVFVDIEKAFDTLDVDCLMEKLSRTDALPPGTWRWVRAYLKGRAFQIVAGDVSSTPVDAPGGTPQGGVLSPQLFLVFIDELAKEMEAVGCLVIMYADDLVALPISAVPNVAANQLRAGLRVATQWAKRNGLHYNIGTTKSAVVRFHDRSKTKAVAKETFTLEGQTLPQVESYNYLGTLFDAQLKMEEHAKRAVARAIGVVARIGRVVTPKSRIPPIAIRTLVKAFVYPTLLYGCHVAQFDVKSLVPLEKAIAHLLRRTMKLPFNSHHLSLYVEFAIPRPWLAIAECTQKAAERLLRGTNYAGLHWQHQAAWKETVPRKQTLKAKLLDAGMTLRVGQTAVTAMEATIAQWRVHKWGAPLKNACGLTAQPSATPQHYLRLPAHTAAVIASARFDTLSFWREAKRAKRADLSCGRCGAQVGDVKHLATECPYTARARTNLLAAAALAPGPNDSATTAVEFIKFLCNVVKGR